MAASIGTFGALGIDTVNPATKRFDYVSESLVTNEDFRDTNGIRGTRAHSVERVRAGIRRIGGPISLQPTAVELSNILAWILGGTPSGSPTVTYPLGDSITTRYVTIDRVAKVFTYNGVGVNRATFRGSEGNPLSVELDLVGQDEAVANAGTFPAISLDVANSPFMFHDLVLTHSGNTYQAKTFEVTIDNHIDESRFMNSQTLTAVNALDRTVSVRLSLPYGDSLAAYNAGPNGAQVVATFTNGSAVLVLTFVKVTFPRRSPSTPGRSEIMLPLDGIAWKSAGTLELVTTLNVGP